MSIVVLQPGPLTTVQDAGRFGHMSEGFAPCGAADRRAFRLANALLGNDESCAVLEMTLSGATLRFSQDTRISFTGADMPLLLNGESVPGWQEISIHTGDVLEAGFAQSGCRGYLAFAGGIDEPMVLGSRSTFLKCHIGGHEGRKLQEGDILPLNPDAGRLAELTCRAPEYPHSLVLRYLPGPQENRFNAQAYSALNGGIFTVSADADRMGVRLLGTPLPLGGAGSDILSDGIPLGGIQVPSSGLPIVLMRDRQTTGGYAKIGVVLSPDLDALAQARPGDEIRFVPVTARQAQKIYRHSERILTREIRTFHKKRK